MMKHLLFLLSILCSTSLLAQKINIDSLKHSTLRPEDDTVKVIAYRALTGITLDTDPRQAIAYGKKGIALGKRLKFDKGVAGCYLNTSAAYSSAGRLDSARLYIDTAIVWSRKVGAPARIALAYINRADIKMQQQDFKGTLMDCDTSLFYADQANKNDTKARIFQTIGSVYYHQKDYDKSDEYYHRAYERYQQSNNSRMMAIIMNNIGNVNKHQGKYEAAIANFKQAIEVAGAAGDQTNQPIFYENLGDAYFGNGQLLLAEEAATTSIRYARENKNEIQIANSLNVLTNIFLNTNRTKKALATAAESFELSTRNQLLNVNQIAAEQLAEAYFKSGDFQQAYHYQLINKELSDSLARERFKADVALLQTAHQLNEKESQIALLTQENELHTQKQRQDSIVVTSVSAIALLLVLGVVLLLNRNRISQRVKELELRTRIASDLHDEIGSSLSSIHLLTQLIPRQSESSKRNDLFDTMARNVKETAEKMTDIVWMIKPDESAKGNLQQRMERFAYDICAGKEIELDLNLSETGHERLSMEQRKNIYLIFKESVNNAVKYSGTNKLIVSMEVLANKLILSVKDEGNGFDPDTVNKGNGIDNIKARARELNATISVVSAPAEGTTLTLVMVI